MRYSTQRNGLRHSKYRKQIQPTGKYRGERRMETKNPEREAEYYRACEIIMKAEREGGRARLILFKLISEGACDRAN